MLLHKLTELFLTIYYTEFYRYDKLLDGLDKPDAYVTIRLMVQSWFRIRPVTPDSLANDLRGKKIVMPDAMRPEFPRMVAGPDLSFFIASHGLRTLGQIMVDRALPAELALAENFRLPLPGLFMLYVHAEHRRRGVGTILVNHALDHIRGLGYLGTHLLVDEANEPARDLYEKTGFVDYRRGPLELDGGEPDEHGFYPEFTPPPTRVMIRSLSPSLEAHELLEPV